MNRLKARGESTDGPMINIFKDYQLYLDTKFVRYIKAKKYRYGNYGDISADKLMTFALIKCEIYTKAEN